MDCLSLLIDTLIENNKNKQFREVNNVIKFLEQIEDVDFFNDYLNRSMNDSSDYGVFILKLKENIDNNASFYNSNLDLSFNQILTRNLDSFDEALKYTFWLKSQF